MPRIVIWDPTGDFPEGELVYGTNGIAVLHSKGGVTLPVELELLKINAVSGFFSRNWGSGIKFDRMLGTRACPMLLFVQPDFTRINWAARLEFDGDHQGTFRLTTDSSQMGGIGGGLAANEAAIDITDLEPDEYGGVTIGGTCKLNCTTEGYLGLSLYGTAIGARVVWSAVTQSK